MFSDCLFWIDNYNCYNTITLNDVENEFYNNLIVKQEIEYSGFVI